MVTIDKNRESFSKLSLGLMFRIIIRYGFSSFRFIFNNLQTYIYKPKQSFEIKKLTEID